MDAKRRSAIPTNPHSSDPSGRVPRVITPHPCNHFTHSTRSPGSIPPQFRRIERLCSVYRAPSKKVFVQKEQQKNLTKLYPQCPSLLTRRAHPARMSLTLTTRGVPAPIARAPASCPRVHRARGAASHRRCKPHASQRRPAVLGADSAADLGLDGGEYSRELETALEAVRLASTLCQDVQGQLMRMDEQAETKEDRSLVTLADYAAQAIISWCVRRVTVSMEMT